MPSDLLTNHFIQYFQHVQPKVVQEEEIIENAIFHSPFLTARSLFEDILPTINSDKFYALSLVGPQGKGKTFLSSIFATLAEDEEFLLVYAKAEDIYSDLELWKEKVRKRMEVSGCSKVCFGLDDMSYSFETIPKKQAAIFKHFIADVRHQFEEVFGDVQIFMIYLSHRLHSLPPMLRNSGSWIFSSMQSADRDDAVKLIARRKEMRDKLDAIYYFISQVSIDGPKYKKLKLNFGNNSMDFVWGSKETPGDGRLMVSYHAGDIKIFNSKILPNQIEFDSDLYRIKYVPRPPPTEEEVEADLEKKKKDFEDKARLVTTALNKSHKEAEA